MKYDPKDAADFIVASILFALIVTVWWMFYSGKM
jgi:hypothetical protein|tara:strand:+ start:586 stop:687 length:102 start_codon:yes stop_codon:yes gene_type:complete